MSDDIVTRLRECWCANAFSDRGKVDPTCDHDGVRAEAADEIERLRADVERWRKLAHAEHYAWSQCPLNCVCMSDLYRKAKRDE